jgi:membrane-associated phospholipid phosphatase
VVAPRRACAALLALGLLATATRGSAQGRPLGWNPPVDYSVTIGSGLLLLTSLAAEPALAPLRCRWCEENRLDESVRTSLVWEDTAAADDLSSFTAFIATPTAMLGLDAAAAAHDHATNGVGLDALIILEATMIALDVDSVTKLLAARERPYVRSLPRGADGERRHTVEDNLSFFSGHTTTAFALAASTGTVATMRGYRWAPVPWVVGGALGAGTGYLRIAADRHWLTDVLVGMVAGVAIGVAVPLLAHSPTTSAPGP